MLESIAVVIFEKCFFWGGNSSTTGRERLFYSVQIGDDDFIFVRNDVCHLLSSGFFVRAGINSWGVFPRNPRGEGSVIALTHHVFSGMCVCVCGYGFSGRQMCAAVHVRNVSSV